LARPHPKQRHSLCQNLVELKISGMQCSETAPGRFYAALPNLISLNLNCYHLQSEFFTYLFAMDLEEHDAHFFLPKLTTLTTSGISLLRMRHLLVMRQMIKHVQMDSKADADQVDEAWLRANTESFEFFDDSEDEDEDTTDAESDGVPDDDDDLVE